MSSRVIFISALVMAAASLCLPSRAVCAPFGGGDLGPAGSRSSSGSGWNQCIIALAGSTCQGFSSYGKNGCYAYLEGRFQCKQKGAARDWCSKRCDQWFNGTSQDKCEEGCDFLGNKE